MPETADFHILVCELGSATVHYPNLISEQLKYFALNIALKQNPGSAKNKTMCAKHKEKNTICGSSLC